jgi:hypothetical protein
MVERSRALTDSRWLICTTSYPNCSPDSSRGFERFRYDVNPQFGELEIAATEPTTVSCDGGLQL